LKIPGEAISQPDVTGGKTEIMETKHARHPSAIVGGEIFEASRPVLSRRRVTFGAAAFVGLALTAGCTPGARRCFDIVGAGGHGSHQMKKVPCPDEEKPAAS
jgi:hypothetical protein